MAKTTFIFKTQFLLPSSFSITWSIKNWHYCGIVNQNRTKEGLVYSVHYIRKKFVAKEINIDLQFDGEQWRQEASSRPRLPQFILNSIGHAINETLTATTSVSR